MLVCGHLADHSHFQKVIENLNKIRAEQDEEENSEDFMSTKGQDEEASNVDVCNICSIIFSLLVC